MSGSVYWRLQGLSGFYGASCTGHPPGTAMNHLSVLSQEWKQQNKVTADLNILKDLLSFLTQGSSLGISVD